MMATRAKLTTEERIKEAAKIVFTKKGYAGTRTRDIAEEAGLNLALLNYYFRSKEKLFELIMAEKVQYLFSALFPILNDRSIALEDKVEKIVANYIDLLVQNPDLPIFVLSELRNNPEHFGGQIQVGKLLKESHFVQQLKARRKDLNPIHFVMSLLGMIIFPFIAKPVLFGQGKTNKEFDAVIEDRKKLIPLWLNAQLNAE